MHVRSIRPALLAPLLLCALAARGEDTIYGPDGAPTVVQRKLFTMTGKWEVGLLGSVALNTALVDQYGGLLTAGFHPNEWLDLGVEVVVHRAVLSSLAQNVRLDLRARTKTPLKDEFANDNQLRAGAFLAARFAPIYGKFNLASELKIHFQAYLLGGAGAAAVHRESVNLCNTPGTAVCDDSQYQSSDAVKPIGLVGGGFRFYLTQRWSVRTEARGYFFSSSYKEGNDLTQPSTGTPHGYLAAIAALDVGVSFLF